MIQKTHRRFRRFVSLGFGGGAAIEGIERTTWWLFGFIPLYSTDAILTTTARW